METLGERIRSYRQRARLSQSELAGDEFSASYISLIESGRRQPSSDALTVLARRLDCRVRDLTADETDDATSRLILSYARLTLTNGEPAVARDRLLGLLGQDGLSTESDHEARALLAEAYRLLGDLDEVIRIREPLFELACRGRSHLTVAEVSYPLVHACLSVGDVRAAVRIGERAVRHSKEAGQDRTDSHFRLESTLMIAYFDGGDLNLAWRKATELIQVTRAEGSLDGLGAVYWNAAVIAESRGDTSQAVHLSERALALFSEQGVSRYVVHLQQVVSLMIMKADLGKAGEAAALLDDSLSRLRDLGSATETSRWETLRALAHFLQGELSAAEPLARRAVLHFRQIEEHRETAEALLVLGDILTAQGRTETGRATYREAVQALDRGRPTHRYAAVYCDLAQRFDLAGDAATGRDCLHRALDIAHVPGNPARGELAFMVRDPGRVPARFAPARPEPDFAPARPEPGRPAPGRSVLERLAPARSAPPFTSPAVTAGAPADATPATTTPKDARDATPYGHA
ncbi:MAG: helix-turn-helix domain-containing protein [Kineosporiaceae bacterium]